jgi:Ca-activated chloride channel homolog
MIEFQYLWVFILSPFPLLIRWLLPVYSETRVAVNIPFLERLSRLTGRKPAPGAAVIRSTFTQKVCILLAWGAILTALARPQWIEDPVTKIVSTRDLLLAVDLSGSMEAEDFTDESGKTVDRLTAVKQVLDAFLTRRTGDRVGLLFFGSAAFVQAPFTEDHEVVSTLLDEAQVRMAGPRTMLGDAIGLALNVFENSKTKERVLIVLTDGNDTESQVPPEKAAEIARDRGITIHTVAMGDPASVGEEKLDEETLQAMSQITGGSYFHGTDRKELEEIYRKLDELETRKIETISHRPKHDLYHWPLGVFTALGLVLHTVMLFRLRETAL